jgi:hypothetical protein
MSHPGTPTPYQPWREPPAQQPDPRWLQPPPSIVPPAVPTSPAQAVWPAPAQYLPGGSPYGHPAPPARPGRRRIGPGVVIAAVAGLIFLVCLGLVAYFPAEAAGITRAVFGPGNATSREQAIISSAELERGMCLNVALGVDGEVFRSISVVECAGPHASEVVGTVTLPKGSYPGTSGLTKQAEKKCVPLADKYVNDTLDLSSMYLGYLGPTSAQWSMGNRVLACLAGNPDEPRTGTIRG